MSFTVSPSSPPRLLIALIGLIALSLSLALRPATAQSPAEPSLAAAADPEAFVLEFREEAGGNTVDMRGFLRVLDRIFDDLRSQWDPLQGILEIKVEGQVIQALSSRSVVIIDKRMHVVRRPIRVNSKGQVSIPVETVSLILKSLGIDFDVESEDKDKAKDGVPSIPLPVAPQDGAASQAKDSTGPGVPAIALGPYAATATTPTASRAPAIDLGRLTGPSSTLQPSPTPGGDGGDEIEEPPPVIEVRPETPEALVIPEAPQIPPAPAATYEEPFGQDEPVKTDSASPALASQPEPLALQVPTRQASVPGQTTAIEAPTALAGRIGLTWGQLADLGHRRPPRRVTLVCEQKLAAVAKAIERDLSMDLGVDVRILVSPSARRDSEGLLSNVVLSEPDLLVDLLAVPAEAAAERDQPYYIWVVHEALWPQDRNLGSRMRSMAQNYRRHQFQSLALGSLLRTELGREFSGRMIFYELAPSFLLRRTDAPSAAVLIPRSAGEDEGKTDDRLARAIAGAIATYIRGMEAVRF